MIKIVSIVGARPQFIKAAVVSRALSAINGITEDLVHTGQHFDVNMSDVFFHELSLPVPAYNLGIGGGNHGAMTGAQLAGIEQILIDKRPDLVLVYGDTNSTLAGALAAAKLGIPVAHVEAGLRSFDRNMPEEINRVLTDHLSTHLFAPTTQAITNLQREGISPDKCHLVGDVMFDAALQFSQTASTKSHILEQLDCGRGHFVLLTIHRAENTDDQHRLLALLTAANRISEHLPVVWPVHPRTRKAVAQLDRTIAPSPNIKQIDPVGYLDMLMLESNAAVVATDSGGVQKEAFFFRVPCVTLRDRTEWVELTELGWNTLSPTTDPDRIAQCVLSRVGTKGTPATPYGDGSASVKIAKIIVSSSAHPSN